MCKNVHWGTVYEYQIPKITPTPIRMRTDNGHYPAISMGLGAQLHDAVALNSTSSTTTGLTNTLHVSGEIQLKDHEITLIQHSGISRTNQL